MKKTEPLPRWLRLRTHLPYMLAYAAGAATVLLTLHFSI